MRQSTKKLFSIVTVTLASISAFAQEAAETAAASPTGITLGQLMEKGGAPMKVIVILSIVAVFLVLYYLLTLRGGALYPKSFLREAEDAAAAGDIDALIQICNESDSAAASIVGAVAEHMDGDAKANYEIIRDTMEDEGNRQAGVFWQRIQYLMDVAIIAPMVGLLGTVLGMMQAFAGLEAGVSIANRAEALARGVGQAMYTTAGGLVVGIIAMFVYAVFRGIVNRHVGRLELACNRVIRAFVASGRK